MGSNSGGDEKGFAGRMCSRVRTKRSTSGRLHHNQCTNIVTEKKSDGTYYKQCYHHRQLSKKHSAAKRQKKILMSGVKEVPLKKCITCSVVTTDQARCEVCTEMLRLGWKEPKIKEWWRE